MLRTIDLPRYRYLRKYMQSKRSVLFWADITINVVIYGGVALMIALAVYKVGF